MQGNVLGQSGGSAKINGIIEQYKVAAGENIKAGDFVEYVKNISYDLDFNFYSANNTTNKNIVTLDATEYGTDKVAIIYKLKNSRRNLCCIM